MINSLLGEIAPFISTGSPATPLICFFAGVLTSLTPCSLSVIPIIIGYVKGSGVNDAKYALRLSLVFTLGMSLSFTAMGATAAIFGKFIGSANRYFYLVTGVLMILMALQAWELYTFIPATNLVSKSSKRGYLGAALAGGLSGLFSSACATPVLVVLLSLAARSRSPVTGVMYLFLFSLGHGVLITAAGSGTGFAGKITSNKSYGAFSTVLKIFMGLVMLLMGLYMLYLFF